MRDDELRIRRRREGLTSAVAEEEAPSSLPLLRGRRQCHNDDLPAESDVHRRCSRRKKKKILLPIRPPLFTTILPNRPAWIIIRQQMVAVMTTVVVWLLIAFSITPTTVVVGWVPSLSGLLNEGEGRNMIRQSSWWTRSSPFSTRPTTMLINKRQSSSRRKMLLRMSSTPDNESTDKEEEDHKRHLEDDISRKFSSIVSSSFSKHRAISALSRKSSKKEQKKKDDGDESISPSGPNNRLPAAADTTISSAASSRRTTTTTTSDSSSASPPPRAIVEEKEVRNSNNSSSSLLPPTPLPSSRKSSSRRDTASVIETTNNKGGRNYNRRVSAFRNNNNGSINRRVRKTSKSINGSSSFGVQMATMNGNNNPPPSSSEQRNRRKSSPPPKSSSSSSSSFSSLLPPPLTTTTAKDDDDSASSSERRSQRRENGSKQEKGDYEDDDALTTGLSSWEQFLGVGTAATTPSSDNSSENSMKNLDDNSSQASKQVSSTPPSLDYNDRKRRKVGDNNNQKSRTATVPSRRRSDPALAGDKVVPPEQQRQQQQELPSIQDLFPPDLLSSPSPSLSSRGKNEKGRNRQQQPQARKKSKQQQPQSPSLDGVLPVADLFYRSSSSSIEADDGEEHDDEELPFSAEQSDAVSSDHNKIRIRRNLATRQRQQPERQQQQKKEQQPQRRKPSSRQQQQPSKKAQDATTKVKGRKMVRRGMEMLVGGVPINADPPQRSIQLLYDPPRSDDGGEEYDWASTIALDTRDFGPLLHAGSIGQVSQIERGLFCEYFCHAAIKWDICPKDLRQIVKSHKSKVATPTPNTVPSEQGEKSAETSVDEDFEAGSRIPWDKASSGSMSSVSTTVRSTKSPSNDTTDSDGSNDDVEFFETRGEFSFEIGVSRQELESGEGGHDGGIFRSVFARAFMSLLERAVESESKDESENFVVEIPQLRLHETDDGYTAVTVEFRVEAGFATSYADMERRVKRISAVFTEAIDDGDIAIAIAAAAKEESRWPESVRDRVVEECLFQDDDNDEPSEFAYSSDRESTIVLPPEKGLVGINNDQKREELYLGGGVDGVFHDFSAENVLESPYQGEIGLRLVDAVTERAKQRHPRVLAIGDVHGCIDELQDLLRQCDYRPGDLVVFLGDLVCKGPDSISVVQMAREIGAIGVRGNHDFEVVRWHQAIKSGVDPPVFASEHFHIASCLSKADMKWMYSLPWYVSSSELGILCVHAGFVSGIRLKKQNPRLMMNMRSILPDGTVTSKFFSNWPWARLWDGPSMVLFGHDADRGLQQYEHAIGLDTGCVYGGRLTACILPEKRLVSVSARREYFKYRRRHYD